eukprot:m.98976 g.98976  ORF g.98976 m.98976 type:complete len:108 (-) comp16766_c0_seq1:136-459(-)
MLPQILNEFGNFSARENCNQSIRPLQQLEIVLPESFWKTYKMRNHEKYQHSFEVSFMICDNYIMLVRLNYSWMSDVIFAAHDPGDTEVQPCWHGSMDIGIPAIVRNG